MFSDVKVGDKVWTAWGRTNGQGTDYNLRTIDRITPKKNLIVVGSRHFHSTDGSSTDIGSTYHIEKSTPEFDEFIRRKKFIKHVCCEVRGVDLTYEQAVAIHEILFPSEDS